MAGQEETKWEGKATVKLNGPNAQLVWQTLVKDFCNITKWVPVFDTCRHVEGVEGEVGAVRYVSATVPAAAEGGGEATVNWFREKLIKVDHGERCLTYQVVESNAGIKTYLSTYKVLPLNGQGEPGCQIEWSYVVDPFEGMTGEGIFGFYNFTLQAMAEKMEKELS